MIARRGVLATLMGGSFVLLTGCRLGKSVLRYRMTIEVQTLFGLKSGSSVLEYEYPNNHGMTYGQSPYVDLGGGRYLFALIDQQSQPWGAFRYCQPPIPRDDVPYSEFDRAHKLKASAILRPDDYPKLVIFEDVNDPNSVHEAALGSINKVTFQVVDQDEPLSTGLEERFKWAADGNVTLSGERYSKIADAKNLAEQISANSFVWRKK